MTDTMTTFTPVTNSGRNTALPPAGSYLLTIGVSGMPKTSRETRVSVAGALLVLPEGSSDWTTAMDCTNTWNDGAGSWMLSKYVPTVKNTEQDTPLPPKGSYKLVVKGSKENSYPVQVVEGPDLVIRTDGNVDWTHTQSILRTWNMGGGMWELVQKTPETEGEAEKEVIEAIEIIPGAIYRHYGRLMTAINNSTLVLFEFYDGEEYTADAEAELLFEPGSEEWVRRTQSVRISAQRKVESLQDQLIRQHDFFEKMGEAILEKAEEHDWCNEYDEFAAEWDLPQRQREYSVSMSVMVLARSEEEAEELVSSEVSISDYDDFVVRDPEFSVSTY